MQPVLNVEDVKRVEYNLTRSGVSVSELMRRAGAAVSQEVIAMGDVGRAIILAGFGNNGGDGWVAAECLRRSGIGTIVITPINPDDIRGDLPRVVAQSARDAGVEIVVAPPRERIESLLHVADVVVDAMLGTGFRGDEPGSPFDIWIDVLNESARRVVSVDVPSGLNAQTGHAKGVCVIADTTVTMIALKPGLLADEGRDACGSIVVAPLAEQTERLVLDADPVAWRMELQDYGDVIQTPSVAVDKYSRGSVLVVGGSKRFPGAAIMAARAAARAGAGYVTLAVPSAIVDVVQSHVLEIPVVGLPSTEEGTFSAEGVSMLKRLAEKSSCVLAGPGMCVNNDTMTVASSLLEIQAPLVFDADALNCLARLTNNRLDSFPELTRRPFPLVLTPHHGELGRLMGLPDTPPDSLTSALEAARRIVWSDGGSEMVIVAKGTATASISVEAALLPKPGPATLATAGSGDVLGGIIAAFLAHRSHEVNISLLCSYACEVHGYAASLAAQTYGSRGAMAGDIIDEVGVAVDALEEHILMPDIESDEA